MQIRKKSDHSSTRRPTETCTSLSSGCPNLLMKPLSKNTRSTSPLDFSRSGSFGLLPTPNQPCRKLFHASDGGTGVTHLDDYASRAHVHLLTARPEAEVMQVHTFGSIITKVINAGNFHSLTTINRGISLKERYSRRNSRDMFNDAVGKFPPLHQVRGSARS
jgi:hypothetical protein